MLAESWIFLGPSELRALTLGVAGRIMFYLFFLLRSLSPGYFSPRRGCPVFCNFAGVLIDKKIRFEVGKKIGGPCGDNFLGFVSNTYAVKLPECCETWEWGLPSVPTEVLSTYYTHFEIFEYIIQSVLSSHIALSIKTCHMVMAEPSTDDMFAFLK